MPSALDKIQSGARTQPGDRLARAGLWALSGAWRLAQIAKEATLDSGLRRMHTLPRPVISVGNLAVGGTGKTPFVKHVVQRLRAMGKTPAVLARGYGRRPGEALNDEGRELARDLAPLLQRQDPQRAVAGRALLAAHPEIDAFVLDDGFQHRALHRDLDVVLLEATRPFGYGHLLPRGRLREPISALARADLLVLTRSEQLGHDELLDLRLRLRRHTSAPVLAARTCPTGVRIAGRRRSTEALRGMRVILASGLGSPDAFTQTVRSLGAEIVHVVAWPDHRGPTPRAWEHLLRRVTRREADHVLITGKDAARLGPQAADTVAVLEIEVDLPDDDQALLDARLAACWAQAAGA